MKRNLEVLKEAKDKLRFEVKFAIKDEIERQVN